MDACLLYYNNPNLILSMRLLELIVNQVCKFSGCRINATGWLNQISGGRGGGGGCPSSYIVKKGDPVSNSS